MIDFTALCLFLRGSLIFKEFTFIYINIYTRFTVQPIYNCLNASKAKLCNSLVIGLTSSNSPAIKDG